MPYGCPGQSKHGQRPQRAQHDRSPHPQPPAQSRRRAAQCAFRCSPPPRWPARHLVAARAGHRLRCGCPGWVRSSCGAKGEVARRITAQHANSGRVSAPEGNRQGWPIVAAADSGQQEARKRGVSRQGRKKGKHHFSEGAFTHKALHSDTQCTFNTPVTCAALAARPTAPPAPAAAVPASIRGHSRGSRPALLQQHHARQAATAAAGHVRRRRPRRRSLPVPPLVCSPEAAALRCTQRPGGCWLPPPLRCLYTAEMCPAAAVV